jgi:AbrB family looped-hinge helix DNA binding protein
MKTTIDPAGRIVIPKPIREGAHLTPGAPLEVTLRDGRIEITPAPQSVRLVKKGRLLVAEPTGDTPTLEADTVNQTLNNLRQRRRGSI